MVIVRILMMMLLGGLMLDFRRADSASGVSTAAIAIFAGTSLIAAIAICTVHIMFSKAQFRLYGGRGRLILLFEAFFVAWAIVPLLSRAGDLSAFSSVFLPYFLYVATMFSVIFALNGGFPVILLLRMMCVVATVSCIWRVIYATLAGGVDLEEARWQILSPALPFLLGISIAGLVATRHRLLPMAGLLLFLVIVLLSVTRAYLISGAVVVLCTLLLGRKKILPGGSLRRIGRPLFFFGSVVGVLLVAAPLLDSGIEERWTSRLTEQKLQSGRDITVATRLAEYKGQMNALTESNAILLSGKGLGSTYDWAIQDFDLAEVDFKAIGKEETHINSGAHSTWVYAVYAHGVIVGSLFLLGLLMSFGLALKRCSEVPLGSERFAQIVAFYSIAAFLGISFTTNIFNERLAGVLLGALVAVTMAAPKARARLSKPKVTSAAGFSARPVISSTH